MNNPVRLAGTNMTDLELAPAQEKPSIISYAWVILAVVYFASIVAPFIQFKIPPIMPFLMKEFGINLTQAGMLMSVVALLGLLLALPTSILLHRFGAKITLMVSLGLMALGAGFGAFSSSFHALLMSRVIEGIGIGLMGITAPATIAMWFPQERQGTPMGIWATWVPVGSVLIYNIAPTMVVSLGWQSIWWLGVGLAVAMMVLCSWFIRRPPAQGHMDRQSETAPLMRHALANWNIWLLALEFACMNFAMMGLATYYPTYLNEVRGYPLGQAAFIASLGTFVILFSAPAAGLLSDHISSRRLVLALPFLGAAVLFLFPFRLTGWQIILFMILQGLIIGAIPTATFAAAPEVMKRPEWAGIGLAIVLIGQSLGQLLGPIFFGGIVQGAGWAMAGYMMIPVCLVGFISGWKVNVR
jgi:MFS family permease